MKKMTCKQLGGACDHIFEAKTFNEMAALSQEHGKKMFQSGDEAHLKAMEKMQGIMSTPEAMKSWMKEKEDLFNSL